MEEEEHHHKGVRYADYFFLLAVLFVFLIFFCLLCIGGLIATRWSYQRRTKEKLDDEREKHRREENAWKEFEQKLQVEADRKNERALERELQRKYEKAESERRTTIIKMETPTKSFQSEQQQQPQQQGQQPASICNHSNQFPINNGQPLVQTVFVPQPFYPPPTFPSQYFQQPQNFGAFQQNQGYLGQPQQFQQQQHQPVMPVLAQPEEKPPKPSSKRSPKYKKSPKRNSTEKRSKKEMKEESESSKNDSSTKMTETDVEFEASSTTPISSTATLSVSRSSTSTTKTESSFPSESSDAESELPCLSSDFEISKLRTSPKNPILKDLRKSGQTTTVTETRTVTETLASASGNHYFPSVPTSRTVSRTTVITDLPKHLNHCTVIEHSPKYVAKMPKIWKRRKSPEQYQASTASSSMVSKPSLGNLQPPESGTTSAATSRSSVLTETDKESTATASESGTSFTSTTPTESTSTPIITEPEDSPVPKSPRPPPSQHFKENEKTKLGLQPKTAANVVQLLAKHREFDNQRLPNAKFELVTGKESPKKHFTKSSPSTTISNKTETSKTPTEFSKTSTPTITELEEEVTERTQSPIDRNGIKSPALISVEKSSPPKGNKKEQTKLRIQPKTVANVVQILAKHREFDNQRRPNHRFELVNEEESPKKQQLTYSPPKNYPTSKALSKRSPHEMAAAAVPSPGSFNPAQQILIAPSLNNSGPPTSYFQNNNNSKQMAELNDPFLTNNPYWRSRTDRITQIEKVQSPNSGKFNGFKVKSQETALWLPLPPQSNNENNNNFGKISTPTFQAVTSPKLQSPQIVEIIKSDKTQESP